MVRYSFPVPLFHQRLHAGLSRRTPILLSSPSILRQRPVSTREKPSTLEENCDKSQGVWGAEPPIMAMDSSSFSDAGTHPNPRAEAQAW